MAQKRWCGRWHESVVKIKIFQCTRFIYVNSVSCTLRHYLFFSVRVCLCVCVRPCNVEGFSASQPYSFRCEFETSTSTFTKEYGFTLNPNIAKRHPKNKLHTSMPNIEWMNEQMVNRIVGNLLPFNEIFKTNSNSNFNSKLWKIICT